MIKNIEVNELPNHNLIAIDGTSGSGKSTLAKGLAKKLQMEFLETGSLYRAATLLCLRKNIDVNNEDQILDILQAMDFKYESQPFLDGEAISEVIKSHDVVMNVSYVSVHPKVRSFLTQIVRDWILEHGGGVIEGRDITSVVAPDAVLKIFVDAPPEIRAARRSKDPKDNIENLSREKIDQGIKLRDKIDSSRVASPLVRVDGVWEIDSSVDTPEIRIEMIAKKYSELTG